MDCCRHESRCRRGGFAGLLLKAFVHLVILGALLGVALAQLENRRLQSLLTGIKLDTRFNKTKIELLPTQTMTQEDPTSHPETKQYKSEGGANVRYVYVIRSRAGRSVLKFGIGFEERVIWKTGTNM